MHSSPQQKSTPEIDPQAIRALVSGEMEAVDREIQSRLASDVVLINQLGAYIINSGGKRLRPLLVLLAARAFDYQGPDLAKLAAIIEFIHTATLLHDDVVDASELRRGNATANAVWGNEASVLVGDFLYSRSFEMMVELDNMRIMDILAGTTNTIAEGEVMQLMNCNDPDTTEDQYLAVIYNKTAKLFEAATQLGAIISNQSSEIETGMARYGMYLGTAFQLVDDLLDYSGSGEDLGKNVGDDLAEGKPTLPLIHALREGDAAQKKIIRDAIENGGLDNIDAVMEIIESTGSIAYTARQAEAQAELARAALAPVPDSPFRQALIDLTHYSIHRSH
jgi:octaprenyl-diphosphate synthase